MSGFLEAIGIFNFAKKKNKEFIAFLSIILASTGAVFTIGFSLFPFIIPSNIKPNQSLVIWNSSSFLTSLIRILIIIITILPIILIYTTFIYKKYGEEILK